MSKTLRTVIAGVAMAFGMMHMASATLTPTTIDFSAAALTDYATSDFGNASFTNAAIQSGYLQAPCAPSGCTSTTLVITIANLFHGNASDPLNPLGLYGIKFDFATDIGATLTIRDAAGNAITPTPSNLTDTTGFGDFHPVEIFFDGEAKFIEFEGAATGFAIDNLSFVIDKVTTTPTPEPASVALVALALAGAATATRRRKS